MIEMKEVTKRFQDKKKSVTALNHVSFSIQKGETVGLLGENGAGKTTLLRAIATLITPDEGSIEVDGNDTVKKPGEIKKNIGVLFGGETGLYERLTARENLEYFAALYGLSKHETKVRIDELSKMFGMKDFLNRKVNGFSKGMRQKVAISRTIIHNPEIILFDEPTSALDPKSTLKIEELIEELKREYSIVIVTHNMQQAARVSDKTAFFLDGEVIEYNNTNIIFNHPRDQRTEDYIQGRFG